METDKTIPLTNDQIRVKVAELCGYTRVSELTRRDQWVKDGKHYQVYCNGHEMNAGITFLPNYPLSLDACAEFEKTLVGLDENLAYETYLEAIMKETDAAPFLWSATPLQRCLAFIAVKEEK